MTNDLNAISAFLAVAEARSFRAASERLGVSRPAVSQALRRLENRLGVALLQRTTRSVALTEAGARLYSEVAPAIMEVAAAIGRAADRDTAPSGVLRLAVSSIADNFLSGPLLAGFVEAYPGIRLDVVVTDDEFDIVAEGYDAGVRLGEAIAQDMVAVPVSADQCQVIVAAPAYLDRCGMPQHPRDLLAHACIGWRPAPDVAPYRWEFEEAGHAFEVAVNPRIATNDMRLMVNAARAGGGLTCGMQETFQPYLDSGELVTVLEAYCPPFAGFFLYFPDRRNLAPKLRALVNHVRRRRTGSRAG
jgi:DNA-binding transcriptional LysR family regulator